MVAGRFSKLILLFGAFTAFGDAARATDVDIAASGAIATLTPSKTINSIYGNYTLAVHFTFDQDHPFHVSPDPVDYYEVWVGTGLTGTFSIVADDYYYVPGVGQVYAGVLTKTYDLAGAQVVVSSDFNQEQSLGSVSITIGKVGVNDALLNPHYSVTDFANRLGSFSGATSGGAHVYNPEAVGTFKANLTTIAFVPPPAPPPPPPPPLPPVTSVPEPQSWLLMLVGIALAGALLRRGRGGENYRTPAMA